MWYKFPQATIDLNRVIKIQLNTEENTLNIYYEKISCLVIEDNIQFHYENFKNMNFFYEIKNNILYNIKNVILIKKYNSSFFTKNGIKIIFSSCIVTEPPFICCTDNICLDFENAKNRDEKFNLIEERLKQLEKNIIC